MCVTRENSIGDYCRKVVHVVLKTGNKHVQTINLFLKA